MTLHDAIRAHASVTVSDTELASLVAYVAQIGSQESAPGTGTPNTGTGLAGAYYNNLTLEGNPALERTERVNFTWTDSPGPGVNANGFSVRWTGSVEASAGGTFLFRTRSNDGVRLWVNGNLVIDNWAQHGTTDDQSPPISLVWKQRYSIVMEYYDVSGTGVARLYWKTPSSADFATVPIGRLYAN